jgi:hypothetical protein
MENFSLQERVPKGFGRVCRASAASLKQILEADLRSFVHVAFSRNQRNLLAPGMTGIKNRPSLRKGKCMITRRGVVLNGLVVALAASSARHANAAQGKKASQPAKPSQAISDDPVAILNGIYARAAKGKGDEGAGFVIENDAAKAKYLSKSLIELWARADANTPKEDVPPIDFDPVTNSQEPDVKSFTVVTEKLEADTAVIAVTISGRMPRAKPSDNIIRYNYIREDGKWKIDDISGTIDGEAWSLRDILKESLKAIT